jgi:hypothetical protein
MAIKLVDYDRGWGLVAILDALGASSYTEDDIQRFLGSRKLVLTLLDEKADAVLGEIRRDHLTTFTFNDTVMIIYRTVRPSTLEDIKAFFTLLRKFTVDSLANGILFRGSVAIGPFYVDDSTNTILGPAVTDAASWYDRADWIGVHATPHASMYIDSLIDGTVKASTYLYVEYLVPLNDGDGVPVKAINWPKAFYVPSLTPSIGVQHPRAKCLTLFAHHTVPKGTESKYRNSIAFFDHVVKEQKLEAEPLKAPKVRRRR